MRIPIPKDSEKICAPQSVAKIFHAILDAESPLDKEKEHFWVVGLSKANNIKIIELLTIGTTDRCAVYPKEVFRALLHYSCCNFVIVHNHPGGTNTLSSEDINLANRLKQGAEYMDFDLLDNIVIFGESGYYSAKENGKL